MKKRKKKIYTGIVEWEGKHAITIEARDDSLLNSFDSVASHNLMYQCSQVFNYPPVTKVSYENWINYL